MNLKRHEILTLKDERLAVTHVVTGEFIRWYEVPQTSTEAPAWTPQPMSPSEAPGFGRQSRTLIDWDRFNPNGQ